jgi:hypothetical protein
MQDIKYGDWKISHNPKPIPSRAHDWDFVHDDYDGAPDSNDNRCGSARDVKECVREIWMIENEDAEGMTFPLLNNGHSDDQLASVEGRVEIGPGGVEVLFEGYGTCCMKPGYGSPIFIEYYEDKLTLRVWSDINSEDPTHVIDLEAARESARRED